MPEQWFHKWFGSPYYHLLYSKRDNEEAGYFIDKLCDYLQPDKHAQLLDIACGRGRHAIYLNKKGYNVTGIDLAIENIQYASQYEKPTLHFFVHDMRRMFYLNYFDIAFNLFTSFGYFDTEEKNIMALKAFNNSLKANGLLVLDFFNSHKVLNNLQSEQVTRIHGIDFYLSKRVENNRIIKTIKFEDKHQAYQFEEIVCAFTLDDFTCLFKLSGFEIIEYFGDYSLGGYVKDASDRLIFICKKAHV